MLEILLPLFQVLITKVIIPEVLRVKTANPALTDEQVIAALSADVQAILQTNQAFLDSIRAQAGH